MPAIPKKGYFKHWKCRHSNGTHGDGRYLRYQKRLLERSNHLPLLLLMKLIGLCAIFLPIAVKLGFRTDKLVAILIMLGSATTVSSFVMAKNMGHEGTLSSSVVMLTTMFSAFTVTGWLYILRHFMLI